MTWRAVAHRDVRTAGRSWTIWALSAFLALAALSYAGVHGYLGEESFQAFLAGLAGLVGVFLPLLAILLGYKAVVHERTSGALFLSLSGPTSRRDLVVGKLVGRAIVLLAPTLVALVLAGVAGMALYGTDGALLFPWFLVTTACYGLAFLGITIGLSLSTTNERRISLGALGGYLLLVMLWDNVHTMTMLILHRFNQEVPTPDWALLVRMLKPSESYYRLLRAGFDVDLAGVYAVEGAPLYVGWVAALVVLVAWLAVPLALGFRRFERADL